MKKMLINISKNLKNSQSYQNKKNFLRELLTNRETSYTKYFDSTMIVLILFSVFILVLNKTYDIPKWILFIDIWVISAIFLLEYILRFWIHSDVHEQILEQERKKCSLPKTLWVIVKSKFKYIFSLAGIIDLLAIFPQFRIMRLLKLYHYLYGAKTLLKALSKKEFEFKFLGYILVTVVFSFASVLYIAEHGENPGITSFLDAIYWALVTVSTVGYGDISPVTDLGKIIAMVGIILGIAMISFVTSVMVSAFAERFDELRTYSSINSLYNLDNVVVLNGYGYLGSRIAHYIKEETNYNCVVIEENKEKSSKAFDSSHITIYGDGCSVEVMKKIYKNETNIVAMLTLKASDIDNIYFILNAKSYNRNSIVLSRITHAHLTSQYNSIGTDKVINPYAIIHNRAYHYIINQLQENNRFKISVFGYGQKSKNLVDMCISSGIDVEIYDNVERSEGQVMMLDFEKEEHLETLKDLSNNLIICAMDDEAINHYLAISLKVNEFNGKIIALSDTKQKNRQLKLAGADVIFDLYDESAKEFISQLNEVGKN
ncbi:MAG: Potassium voltage-gated channel subfamily KQT; possible potassium channel, VIC family [uncultured Sulfurovum sp.]|uniref:Potassium voltage-gated channel subfamily KQT possible potassium channel, VIC family n=1 Tax=uncultured Sulfurovum sp. TaxID=269237 RepID=A0A6S6SA32_9BACT|nr:MAG: Potassium voltage-gated channel subfamily KQT; possible potassium channel, VIC family [uncultured Sulfurovum sp.]